MLNGNTYANIHMSQHNRMDSIKKKSAITVFRVQRSCEVDTPLLDTLHDTSIRLFWPSRSSLHCPDAIHFSHFQNLPVTWSGHLLASQTSNCQTIVPRRTQLGSTSMVLYSTLQQISACQRVRTELHLKRCPFKMEITMTPKTPVKAASVVYR